MSDSLKEWSYQSKQPNQSMEITRNPTTLKKNVHHITRQKIKTQSSLSDFQQRYQILTKKIDDYLKLKKYKSVILLTNELKRIESKKKKKQQRRLIIQQNKQINSITLAHHQQMEQFYQVWQGIFNSYQQKSKNYKEIFKRSQKQQFQIALQQLNQKIDKIHINKSQIIKLQNQQIGLAKSRRYQECLQVVSLKKNIKKQIKNDRNYLISHITKLENNKLKQSYKKRYNSLMMRLNDGKSHHEQIFKANKYRLQKKYHNIISHLKHQHSMQKNNRAKKLAKSFCN